MTANQHVRNGAPADGEDRRHFPYPRPGFIFADLCWFLPWAVAALLYMPHLTSTFFKVAFAAYTAMAALAPALALLFRWRGKGITLDREGISVHRRFGRWEEIKRIRMGPLRNMPIVVRLDRPRRSILRLPRYPVIFREVVPAILGRRPDLAISDRLRRAIADPETATRLPRWTGTLLAAAALVLMSLPFLARHADAMLVLTAVVASWAPLLPLAMVWGVPHTTEQNFVHWAAGPVVLPVLVLYLHLFLNLPLRLLDAAVAPLAVLLLAAAAVAGLRLRLNRARMAAILILALIAPAAVYALEPRRDLARQDITGLLGPGLLLPPFFWSEDGKLAVTWLADGDKGEQQRVLDVTSLKTTPLPLRPGIQVVRWLDQSFVVRTTFADGKRALHLYRFATDRETSLAPPGVFGVAIGRCISPDRRRLAWLEVATEGAALTLKIHDLDTGGTKGLNPSLPRRDDIKAYECRWADDRAVAILAYEPGGQAGWGKPKGLHLLRVEVENGSQTHTSTVKRFREWTVSPDCRHAFGVGAEDQKDRGVHYVDLGSGRTVRLGGEALPVWGHGGRWAFRVVGAESKQRWLCRIDMQNISEVRVLEIPENSELCALSPRGRFAILRVGRFRIAPVLVVNIQSGEWRRLDLSALALFVCTGPLERSGFFPWLSRWSGDGRRFVINAPVLQDASFKTHLYTLPDDWTEPAPIGPAAGERRPR